MSETPNAIDTNALTELAARVDRLSQGDRLRLAAALIDAGRLHLAETIARNTIDELAAMRLFGPRPSTPPRPGS